MARAVVTKLWEQSCKLCFCRWCEQGMCHDLPGLCCLWFPSPLVGALGHSGCLSTCLAVPLAGCRQHAEPAARRDLIQGAAQLSDGAFGTRVSSQSQVQMAAAPWAASTG